MAMIDPVLENDWHPVSDSAALAGNLLGVSLLGRSIVLWRSGNGAIHAWDDRCPHRGTRLSIGRIVNDTVECAYHGWRFASDARCILVASQPDDKPPPNAVVRSYRVEERYGLVWVCVGDPTLGVLPFPEADDPNLR
ncbi:MAG: Rieske 2Fe-2S domain-containing protein, partial [Betaproteobacteria bacterium]|nr:Rieske 2Fe-2S domain-containing protein [Betaproteobacteria bacterium]